MDKSIAAIGLSALVLAGCYQASASQQANGTGAVDFNLDLPNGDMLNEVTLTIMCEGFTQKHTYDLTTGEELPAFAGLPPGDCTVTIEGTTVNGYDCEGQSELTIIANTIVEPTVAVMCSAGVGDDESETGAVKVDFYVTLVGGECPAPRVLKIFAIPSNLPEGGSTVVEVETQNTTGTTEITFDGDSNPDNVGEVDLSTEGAGCSEGSADCVTVRCTAAGVAYVEVTVSDSQCNDAESISIDCGGEPPVVGETCETCTEDCACPEP